MSFFGFFFTETLNHVLKKPNKSTDVRWKRCRGVGSIAAVVAVAMSEFDGGWTAEFPQIVNRPMRKCVAPKKRTKINVASSKLTYLCKIANRYFVDKHLFFENDFLLGFFCMAGPKRWDRAVPFKRRTGRKNHGGWPPQKCGFGSQVVKHKNCCSKKGIFQVIYKYQDLQNQSKSHVDQVVVDVKIQFFWGFHVIYPLLI